jgi:ribosomal protein L11 methyltransferase
MGFGTGHHATTQLCLEALQAIDLTGAQILDVGTGSGVLAIAAVRLRRSARARHRRRRGRDCRRARKSDTQCRRGLAREVRDRDISTSVPWQGTEVGILTANLTGALLVRTAQTLIDAVAAGGILILSGLQLHERDEVMRAFAATSTIWERDVEEWVGLP